MSRIEISKAAFEQVLQKAIDHSPQALTGVWGAGSATAATWLGFVVHSGQLVWAAPSGITLAGGLTGLSLHIYGMHRETRQSAAIETVTTELLENQARNTLQSQTTNAAKSIINEYDIYERLTIPQDRQEIFQTLLTAHLLFDGDEDYFFQADDEEDDALSDFTYIFLPQIHGGLQNQLLLEAEIAAGDGWRDDNFWTKDKLLFAAQCIGTAMKYTTQRVIIQTMIKNALNGATQILASPPDRYTKDAAQSIYDLLQPLQLPDADERAIANQEHRMAVLLGTLEKQAKS